MPTSSLSIYPSTELDTPAKLVGVLGTFWDTAYANQSELTGELAAQALPWRQAARNLDELTASLAYATIPPLHIQEWQQLTLLESNKHDPRYMGLRYGENTGLVYGNSYHYGQPVASALVPLPLGEIVDLPMIYDQLVQPSVALTRDIDYTIDHQNGLLWLFDDPFLDPRWQPVALYDASGKQTDRQLTLFGWHAAIDRRLLYRRIGYALGIEVPPTENGRALLNIVLDAIVQGTSQGTLERFFAALFDIPLCRSDGEVVEAIFLDSRGLMIATDAAVYRYSPGANAIVAVGDVLAADEPLVDSLRFDSLSRGTIPDGLAALLISGGLLPANFPAELAFINADVPVSALVPSLI